MSEQLAQKLNTGIAGCDADPEFDYHSMGVPDAIALR